MSEPELRGPTRGHADDVAVVINRAQRAIDGTDAVTPELLRLWWTQPDLDPAADVRVAVRAGVVVGYADVGDPNEDGSQLWIDARVPPETRPATLTKLLDWAEVRCTERAAERAVARAFVDQQDTNEPFETWVHDWEVEDGLGGGFWLVAEGEEHPAGICLCRAHEHGDPTLGWVSVLGVREPWRRRGIGRALLTAAFARYRERGFRRVGLGVDAEGEAGAVALYESAGMTVVRRLVSLEKSL